MLWSRGKNEESESEKLNFEKLAIISKKESKKFGSNTKGVDSKLDKELDKLKTTGKLKKQKIEMVSNQIIRWLKMRK